MAKLMIFYKRKAWLLEMKLPAKIINTERNLLPNILSKVQNKFSCLHLKIIKKTNLEDFFLYIFDDF